MTIGNQTCVVGPDSEPDKYQLLCRVSGGGEAELWKADLAFAGGRERVAVKILHERHALDMVDWQDRWAEQAELLRLIQHPSVVGVHRHFAGPVMHRSGEANPASRTLYLVMNWVEGQDLREWVMRHNSIEDRIEGLRYLSQVAAVLDWLHSGQATSSGRAVVHGDISPGNVVVNTDGQAVLVDFGLFQITRHVTDTPAGTPGYRAPELLAGGEYSPASDRYAFGALAYYVLSGEHPPEDPGALAGALGRLPQTVPLPATANDLGRIAAEEPASRPSAGDWIRQLRLQTSTAAVNRAGLPPLAPPHPPPKGASGNLGAWTRGAQLRPGAVLAGVVAVVVTLAVLIGQALSGPSGAEPNSLTAATSSPVAAAPTAASQTPSSAAFTPTPRPVSATSSSPQTTPSVSSRTLPLVTLQPETSELLQGAWTVDAVSYPQSLACQECLYAKSAVYHLAGRYTTFAATLATKSNYAAELKITLDNQEPVLRNATAGHPVELEIDVSGARTMTVSLDAYNPYDLIVLGKAALRT